MTFTVTQVNYVRGIAQHLSNEGMPYEAKFLQQLAREMEAERKPVAWYLPDDNGKVWRATGFEFEAQLWEQNGRAVKPLYE